MTIPRQDSSNVTPLHLNWLPLKEAAQQSGQTERNIRYWAKTAKKVRYKTDEGSSKLLVAWEDVEEVAKERPEKGREPETLPVPIEVLDDMRDMRNQLVSAEARAAKAETVAEYQTDRVSGLRADKERLEDELRQARELAHRSFFRRMR